ncbi:hypothetical protein EUGRSUZ_F01900 [Eucalyptus grandis]|uniref:Uncharacterized protein n=2 Tax=Eucalyptus grandis TaxID=71139 RepID=A0ACC3KGK0_EUCGR|nr:hypothetical protein EUGRSUZ_F01900 [Eucalyptus grandis]
MTGGQNKCPFSSIMDHFPQRYTLVQLENLIISFTGSNLQLSVLENIFINHIFTQSAFIWPTLLALLP